MEIKKLERNEIADFSNLLDIFKEAFEMDEHPPGNEHLSRLLSNPDFMVFVVKLNGKVAGGLTLYVLHSYFSVKPIACIYDVGIMPGFRGKGLGKALIAAVCRFCKQNNFKEAYAEAESDDLDAVHFYRKTKCSHEMNAIHFTYSFENEN